MRRTKILLFCVLGAAVVMLGRLGYLMVARHAYYTEKAENQQSKTLYLNGSRGNIYDRNMVCFTTGGKKKIAVVVRSGTADDMKALRKINGVRAASLYRTLLKKSVVYEDVYWDFNGEALKNFHNACVLEDVKRYSDSGEGAAAIGYLSDGVGVSGMEKAFEDYLKSGDGQTVQVCKDAMGGLLPGLSFIQKSESGTRLKTTLDKTYVSLCQAALKNVKGSAVLLDANTFDLLAMVSAPTFNANHIENYLNDSNQALLNRATAMYDMGSIFKIVVLAAALENGSISLEDTFYCNGEKRVGDVCFLCKNHPGIENLTVKEAFLYSCNAVFIDIGLKTGYNNIIDMAMAFGLGTALVTPTSFAQSTGVLPDTQNYYLADVANVSIGQGKLLGTAVHGAVFSAIIASGGVRKSVNLADSLLNADLSVHTDLRQNQETRVISEETAAVIADLMRETVENGTGKSAKPERVSAAGKTGSAQTGTGINGADCVHGWFTGFFPAENPKYVLCVFVENGRSGATSAAPIFKEIADKIAETEGWHLQ